MASAGVGARCWGSETSRAPGPGLLWLLGWGVVVLGACFACWVVRGLVGVAGCGVWFFYSGREHLCSNCCFVLSFVLASYEGHMVDALASRADEGRSSLR